MTRRWPRIAGRLAELGYGLADVAARSGRLPRRPGGRARPAGADRRAPGRPGRADPQVRRHRWTRCWPGAPTPPSGWPSWRPATTGSRCSPPGWPSWTASWPSWPAALTAARRAAADGFARAVVSELVPLAMPHARLVFHVTPAELGPSGADQVDLLFSANPGSEPRSLAKVASGGELSRIRLALEVVLAAGRTSGDAGVRRGRRRGRRPGGDRDRPPAGPARPAQPGRRGHPPGPGGGVRRPALRGGQGRRRPGHHQRRLAGRPTSSGPPSWPG